MSLHDPDARAIAKGRLSKPVVVDDKTQVVDHDDGGVVTDEGADQASIA